MIARSHPFARDGRAFARGGRVAPGATAGGGLMAQFQLWLERRRERRTLLGLNDHLLKDIGVSRADAWQESQKPFWRP
jgi:uncharacterized protein YjiS (DUF1127 family)